MKTKSKLVLGLSILSAATLAAGATATFAWYQVSGDPSLSNQGNFNITTEVPTDNDFEITAVYTYYLEDSETPVQTIGAIDMTDNTGAAFVVNSAKKYVAYESSQKYYRIHAVFPLPNGAAADHQGESYTVTVSSAQGRIRLAPSTGNWYAGAEVTMPMAITSSSTSYSLDFFVSVKGDVTGDGTITAGTNAADANIDDAQSPIGGTIVVSIA